MTKKDRMYLKKKIKKIKKQKKKSQAGINITISCLYRNGI